MDVPGPRPIRITSPVRFLPYVPRRVRFLQPPTIKAEPSNSVTTNSTTVSRLCPREVVVPLKRIRAYGKIQKNPQTIKIKKKGPTVISYRGTVIRTLRPEILLHRVKIKPMENWLKNQSQTKLPVSPDRTPDPGSSSSEFYQACTPLSAFDSSFPNHDHHPPTDDPVIKIEPEERPDSSCHLRLDKEELTRDNVRSLTKTPVTVRLRRIDDNVLFHIKINNPEAVLPLRQLVVRPIRKRWNVTAFEYKRKT